MQLVSLKEGSGDALLPFARNLEVVFAVRRLTASISMLKLQFPCS